tara:strand:- start:2113 stop:2868 length:756 start_codon:yes stop_codon:yes gene_type:complete
MITKWKILNRYSFSLLPGKPKQMPDGDYSYYQYLNKRWQETGKNVLCQQFLLSEHAGQEIKVDEPFGGCGVFSVAIQEMLKPAKHVIGELDLECLHQLHYCTREYKNVEINHSDAHLTLGLEPADIYVCDFPHFTLIKYLNGHWKQEMERMISHKPRAIIITDGSSCRWHFMVKHLKGRGFAAGEDRESYAKCFSAFFQNRYGYRVTAMAYHGTCFYIKIEPEESVLDGADIRFLKIEAGEGHKGLKPVEE